MLRLALYQPDIPQNTGTILRMAACLGVGVDVIMPAGFDMTDRSLRRAGLDYLDHVDLVRHPDWLGFQASVSSADSRARRIVLLTTKAAEPLDRFVFQSNDILLLGRESASAPEHVHNAADARLLIPMRPGLRSLNIAVAAALVIGEALRQTAQWPSQPQTSGI